MKSLMFLWRELADELASWCFTSATLDYKKLERRVEHEGVSFLTITLPAFCKDFERSLDEGCVSPTSFAGFQRKGGLPLFLGGFLERVFDTCSGKILDAPCIDAIFAIRQLTLAFGKIQIECSKERTADAVLKYVKCEMEIRDSADSIPLELLAEFDRMAGLLWARSLQPIDNEVWRSISDPLSTSLIPRHGPGATADGFLGNEKFDLGYWPSRLDDVFPYWNNAIPNTRYDYRVDDVDFREPEHEQPVKVITVPKTLKTPRVIAKEPTCLMFNQQALLQPIIQELDGDREAVFDATRVDEQLIEFPPGFVGFSQQYPNRYMALRGSREGDLATLDLREASDRVSNRHVELLLRRWPSLSRAVQATRSLKADVPGHGVIPLTKFASMGSALCFPMMSMVIMTIVFVAIQKELDLPLTRKGLKAFRGKVRVYGDDIIVPVEYVSSVIQTLEAFGLVVNTDKSFWTGKFRESCGGDYYDGHDVTPVRVRRLLPTSRRDVPEVVSLVAFRNLLYYRGMWKTVRYLDGKITNLLRDQKGSNFPIVEVTAPGLGRHSFLPYKAERLDVDTHSPRVKLWVTRSKPPRSQSSGEGALLKWFLKQGDEPFADRDHLERSGRPRSVSIKTRWSPPF